MTPAEVGAALASIEGWEAREGDRRLHRHFRFQGFAEAMRFVNAMAGVAEAEGHHPDFCVHYADVEVTLWTHATGGLSENDFIVAAKLDRLPEARGAAHAPAD